MRLSYILLATPLIAAACASDPPPAPVVVAAPPQVSQSQLAQQCQSLFQQSLNGQGVSYSYPTVTSTGDMTLVKLAARTGGGAQVQYNCSFNGSTLISNNPG
ncbi:MAG TPA: hypothetical protein VM689_16195 [Aliidongia sp.]|nr:hypothetical protein [Aliidongia sp.]